MNVGVTRLSFGITLISLANDDVNASIIIHEERKMPYLESFIVSPEKQQGKGYGSIVLDKAIETLKEDGHKKTYLKVLTSNHKAIKLYRRRGFVVHPETHHSMIRVATLVINDYNPYNKQS